MAEGLGTRPERVGRRKLGTLRELVGRVERMAGVLGGGLATMVWVVDGVEGGCEGGVEADVVVNGNCVGRTVDEAGPVLVDEVGLWVVEGGGGGL